MADYLGITEKIDKFARKNVSESRYEHSVRTAKMCARLCRLYGLDESKGYLAGIAHDMCKNLSEEKMIYYASKDGHKISELEMKKTALLHGRAAAVMLRADFGISDEDILQAVAVHTFGQKGMCSLAKCLYIADKIEPGREHVTDEYLERLFKLNLDKMLLTVLNESVEYLGAKGKKVAPETQELIGSLNEKN